MRPSLLLPVLQIYHLFSLAVGKGRDIEHARQGKKARAGGGGGGEGTTSDHPTQHDSSRTSRQPVKYGRAMTSKQQCFQNGADAAKLGTAVMETFWRDILDTECEPDKISLVYDNYFRPDLLVQDGLGNVLSSGLEQYKIDSIGDCTTPGTVSYICEYQSLAFDATEEAFTEPGIYDDFVWIGNQILCDAALGEIEQARQFFIEFHESAGMFGWYDGKRHKSSKSDASSYNYYNGLGVHCAQPQIYTIVIF